MRHREFRFDSASFRGSGLLTRMTGMIAHRGPDGSGIFHDDHAYLGHRRLAIVDVESGAQLMYNETGLPRREACPPT